MVSAREYGEHKYFNKFKWCALELVMNAIYKPGLPNIMGVARIDKWRCDVGQSILTLKATHHPQGKQPLLPQAAKQ